MRHLRLFPISRAPCQWASVDRDNPHGGLGIGTRGSFSNLLRVTVCSAGCLLAPFASSLDPTPLRAAVPQCCAPFRLVNEDKSQLGCKGEEMGNNCRKNQATRRAFHLMEEEAWSSQPAINPLLGTFYPDTISILHGCAIRLR